MNISFLSVHPVLTVDDFDAALAYYRDKLDFEVRWQWGTPPFRAGVARDSVEIQLQADPDLPASGPANVYFHVTGVDEYHRRCVERGAEVTSELEVRPWHMKDFRVVDPSGNRLGFGEPI